MGILLSIKLANVEVHMICLRTTIFSSRTISICLNKPSITVIICFYQMNVVTCLLPCVEVSPGANYSDFEF